MKTLYFGSLRPVEAYYPGGNGQPVKVDSDSFDYDAGPNRSLQKQLNAIQRGQVGDKFQPLQDDPDFYFLPMAEFSHVGGTPVLATGEDALKVALRKYAAKQLIERGRGIEPETVERLEKELVPIDPKKIRRNRPVSVYLGLGAGSDYNVLNIVG